MTWRSRIPMALATLLTLVGLLGTWADRQLLDTGDWTDTSRALLRDQDVRGSVAQVLADEIAPPDRPLLRQGAERVTLRLLDAPRVQQLWVTANRRTHAQFVAVVRDDDSVLARRGVILDLRPLANVVAARAGDATPEASRASRIVILRPDQVQTLQTVGAVLDTLAWLPALLAALLYAAAVWLAGPKRRRAVLVAGASLIAVGLLALVARRIGGHELVTAVAGDGPYEPTASAVWRIATSLLADLAAVVILVGAGAALLAWLAGPSPLARRLRAPIAAEPGPSMAIAALGYLALLAWGPLTVLRRPLPIVLLGALLLAGVWLLRTPDARNEGGQSRAM